MAGQFVTPVGAGQTASGPYAEAYGHVSQVRDFVTGALDNQLDYANQMRVSVEGVVDSLSGFAPPTLSGAQPSPPTISASITGTFDLPIINATAFGTINEPNVNEPGFQSVYTPPEVDIAPFVPSISGLTIPEAPVSMAPGAPPTAPTQSAITLPSAPVLEKPQFPSLEPINIPVFDFPVLPDFNATAPEFEGSPINTVLQWSEPEYQTEVMDEVIAVLRDVWAGGNGIPPAVENAMWERAAGREDLDASRQISAAMTDFSARGFTEPAGMLVARIDAIREESQIKKNALNRERTIRMAEIHVENVRWATEQGVAAENVLYAIWNNTAQRIFESAKIQLDSQLSFFNAQVAVFNAKQSAYATSAQVYKTQLDAQLSRIEVFKAELEGELARGTLNEQRVKIYGEQIRALLTDVEVYKARMEGAKVQADVNRNVLEGFKAEIQAYAAQVDADKTRFEAYDSRVKGELGKAQILDAEARSYAAYVSGQSTVADVGIKKMQADISRNELLVRQYTARLEAARTTVQAQQATIESAARAYTADTQRYTAEASAEEARYRVELAAKESEIRATLGIYEIEIRKYLADMDMLIKQAGIQLEALKAAGQVGSTLAAGAMAGINIGASLQGSGSVGASGGYDEGKRTTITRSLTGNKSWEPAATDTGPGVDEFLGAGL